MPPQPLANSTGASNEADDISMLAPPPPDPWSREYLGIYGPCQWLNSQVPIHYFLTSITVLDLHREIKLMADIPGVEKWGFEALFQRLINTERVHQEIVAGYLRNDGKIKFFPPLTIALLPSSHNAPARNYASAFTKAAMGQNGSIWSMNGLQIQFPFQRLDADRLQHGQPARFKWSHTSFIAVAIDGQHRISALREFVSEHDQDASLKDLPATFILLDPQPILGRDILQATREIFVDVNSKPKTVDESRLILLNDRDVCSDITRQLIKPGFDDDGNLISSTYQPVAEGLTLEILDGVPQELVNVTTGKQTADVTKLAPWQFTSAFLIHKALRVFLIQNEFPKFEDLVGTRSFTAEVALDDPERLAKLEIAERRLELDQNGDEESVFIAPEEMFSFSPPAARTLSLRFLSQWRSLILGLFTGFQPYKELILKFRELEASLLSNQDREDFRQLLIAEGNRITANASGGDELYDFQSATWNKLHSLDQERAQRLKEKIRILRRPEHWNLTSICWLSVFQRGVLFDPLLTRKALGLALGDITREEFADRFVGALNQLYIENWFDRVRQFEEEPVWGGVVLKFNPEGDPIVDPGDPAARRLGFMVRLMVLARLANRWDGEWDGKQGVAKAFKAVSNGIAKFLRAKYPDTGDDQSITARNRLHALLKQVANSGAVVVVPPPPLPTGSGLI